MNLAEAREVARIETELGVVLGIMKEERLGLEKALKSSNSNYAAIKGLGILIGWDRAMERLKNLSLEARGLLKDAGDVLYS